MWWDGMKKITRWQALVDRCEEGWVVLIPEEGSSSRFLIPRELLPAGLRDGSLLLFRVELATADQGRIKEKISMIQKELQTQTKGKREGNKAKKGEKITQS